MIKERFGIEAELVKGRRGEWSVLVNDKVVAKKGWFRFPPEEKVLASVEQAIKAAS